MPAPTPPVDADRAELLELLLRDGVLRASGAQPIRMADGRSARWMVDSLSVSLTARGAALAGRCLLDRLRRFEGRQLATLGVTAIPLLQACVVQSEGRYHGLIIRKQRKPYGSLKLIEGSIDPDQPVVLIDDSIASGSSISAGIAALEQAGLRVEGALCLVRFGYGAGFARLREAGYQLEYVFDIWDDLIPRIPEEPKPPANPSKTMPPVRWAATPAPDGLHPTALARQVVAAQLAGAEIPLPPARLDRDYDSAGGAWLSVRSRAQVQTRHARDGFWHFPGEEPSTAARDVVTAALRTGYRLPAGAAGQALLEDSALAVTLFGALEECTVGELDNQRYGIVVRSAERPLSVGGALPAMPGIAGEWTQFSHARRNNAKLVGAEPYRLYRHDVLKIVEPGAAWKAGGVPTGGGRWQDDAALGGRVAARALALTRAALTRSPPAGEALPDDLLPGAAALYVTVYQHGRVRGCVGTEPKSLDRDLGRLVVGALTDRRFGGASASTDGLAVSVSLLSDAEDMGGAKPDQIGRFLHPGTQALMAYQPGKVGLLLPQAAAQQDLDGDRFALATLHKAGISKEPYRWRRFACTTWLADGDRVRRQRGALPVGEPPPSLAEGIERLLPLLGGYARAHQLDDGRFIGHYQGLTDQRGAVLDPARTSFGAWVLARAGRALGDGALEAAARRTLAHLIGAVQRDELGRVWVTGDGHASTLSEVAMLALALGELPDAGPADLVPALVATLAGAIDRHGRIATHRDPAHAQPSFQDFVPGQVLLALADAAARGIAAGDRARVARARAYYRHRFRFKRHWGQVAWIAQAFAAWHRVDGDPGHAEPVEAAAADVATHQLAGSGGVVSDLQADGPGCSTAVFLEALAAARALARARGDAEAAARHEEASRRAVQFLDGLIYQERDRVLLPAPERALGGVRYHPYAGGVRLDFVFHAIAALIALR